MAQHSPNSVNIDTVFFANLGSQSGFEPDSLFLSVPTGNDQSWVNYDEDNWAQTCTTEDTYGWYSKHDNSYQLDTSTNLCFTSCSYLENSGDFYPCTFKNRNWLILPPVIIGDCGSGSFLEWKSASFYGPFGLDGYKVLVSTSTNFTSSFTDTIFEAAEMVRPLGIFQWSLNPNNYVFSTGYIQANRYTLSDYYFQDIDIDGVTFKHGRLEPHSADLSQYAGKTVYIAFLHDSQCDFQLQIDDILIQGCKTSTVHSISNVARFEIAPNPVRESARIGLDFFEPEDYQLALHDLEGKTVWQKIVEGSNTFAENNFKIEMGQLPGGVYMCHLTTKKGRITKKIIKI